MIFRGALGLGLVWLCAAQGPALGPVPGGACETCENRPVDTGRAWKERLLPRLQAMKLELGVTERDSLVGAGQSEVARNLVRRLAAGTQP